MNSYPIISNTGTVQQFVECWKEYYNEYSDEIYYDHITNDPLEEEDIRTLFEWKNGMVLSGAKINAIESKVLNKIDLINDLRHASQVDFENINDQFKDLAAIWRIFVMHIINPFAFPIFDQHVYRAMRYLKNNLVEDLKNDDQAKIAVYKNEYLPFYKEMAVEIDDPRNCDKALWAFGKFLTQAKREEV
jgi:hypothetical protein